VKRFTTKGLDDASARDFLHWKKPFAMGKTAAVSDNRDANESSGREDGATLRIGSVVTLRVDDLTTLIAKLSELGYEVKGPVVRSGAIVPGALSIVDDLPKGVHDEQAPGAYRLVHGEDDRLFDWAVGPNGWKPEFFPPHEEVWRAQVRDGNAQLVEIRDTRRPLAVFGARPCEAAALEVLDRVFIEGAHRDTRYAERRQNAFVAVVECSSPAATCFCDSMGTGPNVEAGFDLALTELDDEDGHRFLVRVGSARALAVLEGVVPMLATEDDLSTRGALLEDARQRMVRHLEVEGLAGVLARNLEHPRWAEVAERCLSCGNCTLVCPTCFCSDVRDATDLDGDVVRQRTWSSCFSVDHSYLHGGAVRPATQSRYRQWMTHKLSSWWDQFDTTGCVGCGRCIAWCPVGIDITEEASAIAGSDGATAVAPPSVRSHS
jgi:ferredoxin